MSELKQQINADVKSAMRSRDKARLAALRLIQAAFKQTEVDERIALDDTGVLAILNKLAKQHRDSIDQFEQASPTCHSSLARMRSGRLFRLCLMSPGPVP